jgi:predicted dehydrogenase
LITGKHAEPFLGVLLTYPQVETETPATRVMFTSQVRPAAVGEPGIGVLGAGNYASAVFLPAVKKAGGAQLLGIASASGVTARHAATKFGFAYATSNEDEILNDPNVQIVAILTRHQQHARQVLAALRGGKHVFCEKPLAINSLQLEEIFAELNSDRGSLLTVGFNRRFAPLAIQMKQFLNRPEPLLANYRVNAGFLPLTHWTQDPSSGGGRIIGEGCHFIDFISFLVGLPPVSQTARALPDFGRYHQDNVQITLTYADGSIGSLSYLANGDKSFPKERVEVFQGGKVAVLDDFRSLELVGDGRRQVTRSALRQDKGHQAGWQAFLQAIRQGGPAPIPYAHIWGVTQATFAAMEALRLGESVQIPALPTE